MAPNKVPSRWRHKLHLGTQTYVTQVNSSSLNNKKTSVVQLLRNLILSDQHVPQAGSFIPSRWMRNSVHYHPIHPFVSLPWGFGPR